MDAVVLDPPHQVADQTVVQATTVAPRSGIRIAPVTELECCECFAPRTIPPGTQSNEILQCGECGADLEIIESNGVWTLQLAPEEEEDWGE